MSIASQSISSLLASLSNLNFPSQLQNNKMLLASLATAVLGLSGATFLYLRSSSSNTNTSGPSLSEEGTVKFMSAYLENVKIVALRHSRAAENIKQQLQAAGQSIDDRQMMSQYILPHFESALKELNTELFQQYDVDEEEIEEAVVFYTKKGNSKLIEISYRINQLYKEFGGEIEEDEDQTSDPNAPSGSGATNANNDTLTLDEVVAILEALAESMNELMDGYMSSFKSKYGIPTSQELLERFQAGMMKLSEEAEANTLKPFEVSSLQFQKAVMTYQNSREVQQVVMSMQASNQAMMQAHGFAMM